MPCLRVIDGSEEKASVGSCTGEEEEEETEAAIEEGLEDEDEEEEVEEGGEEGGEEEEEGLDDSSDAEVEDPLSSPAALPRPETQSVAHDPSSQRVSPAPHSGKITNSLSTGGTVKKGESPEPDTENVMDCVPGLVVSMEQ